VEDVPAGNGGGVWRLEAPVDLDDADLDIISALKEDGRMPFAEIARRLGVSPGMVRQRFQRLVDNNVLAVSVITNPLLTGNPTMVVVGIKVELDRVEQVAARAAALPEVTWLVIVTGQYDLIAEALCRDSEHLLTFLSHGLHAIEGVRDTETLTQLRVVKEVYY
jgi:Lrp/AsnC family transcriptional regulator for asnA, asnC and gidA